MIYFPLETVPLWWGKHPAAGLVSSKEVITKLKEARVRYVNLQLLLFLIQKVRIVVTREDC